MKAVMANLPEHILEWRHRTGADQWDEMWEGSPHLAPSPNREHPRFEFVESGYRLRGPNAQGWVLSEAANVEMRAAGEKLEIRIAGRDDTLAKLP
jgi:hypothetical protein